MMYHVALRAWTKKIEIVLRHFLSKQQHNCCLIARLYVLSEAIQTISSASLNMEMKITTAFPFYGESQKGVSRISQKFRQFIHA